MESNSNSKKSNSENVKPNKINKRLLKDVANILKHPLYNDDFFDSAPGAKMSM